MPLTKEQTVGAAYKGFNDSLAVWGSGRVMGQQCGQTWLQTFSEINSLYNSGKQLSAFQLGHLERLRRGNRDRIRNQQLH